MSTSAKFDLIEIDDRNAPCRKQGTYNKVIGQLEGTAFKESTEDSASVQSSVSPLDNSSSGKEYLRATINVETPTSVKAVTSTAGTRLSVIAAESHREIQMSNGNDIKRIEYSAL